MLRLEVTGTKAGRAGGVTHCAFVMASWRSGTREVDARRQRQLRAPSLVVTSRARRAVVSII